MSSSTTDGVIDELIKQVKRYADSQGFPKLQVMQQNVVQKTPAYPYVTVDAIDSYIQNEFDPIAENFNMHIQIKAIADDQRVYNNLFEYLRRLFFLQQPTYDLAQVGIGVLGFDVLPKTTDYLENINVFDGGIELSLNVNRSFDDYTQQGEMDSISPNF